LTSRALPTTSSCSPEEVRPVAVSDERDTVGGDEPADEGAVNAERLGRSLADDPVRLLVVAVVLPPVHVAGDSKEGGSVM
jgi:hypothetical protein